MERTGQAQPSFAPVNQHHQRRQQQPQTSTDAGTSTIKPAPAAAGSYNNNMRRTKSQKDNLKVVTFETFKPKLERKRSISLSSAWETAMTTAASRSTDCELYDTVTPAAKVRADERDLGFSKLSYSSYPMKDPLPSCTDAIPYHHHRCSMQVSVLIVPIMGQFMTYRKRKLWPMLFQT